MIDRWDVMGVASAALVAAAVAALAGPWWAVGFIGVLGLALYIAREVRQ